MYTIVLDKDENNQFIFYEEDEMFCDPLVSKFYIPVYKAIEDAENVINKFNIKAGRIAYVCLIEDGSISFEEV